MPPLVGVTAKGKAPVDGRTARQQRLRGRGSAIRLQRPQQRVDGVIAANLVASHAIGETRAGVPPFPGLAKAASVPVA
jgi:hypothetical protein